MKAPLIGFVKTRLAKSIGEQHALALYKNFVKDTIEATRSDKYRLKLFFHPPQTDTLLKTWLGKDYELSPQQGCSLGERMYNAFKHVFDEGYDQAALIGTDIPDLPRFVPNEAFHCLNAADVVIGPALDGGYYLIGFNADTFLPDVFQGIPWGTAMVFDKTRRCLHCNKRRVLELPMMQDIDDKGDLKAMIAKCKHNKSVAPHTCDYLLHQKAYF